MASSLHEELVFWFVLVGFFGIALNLGFSIFFYTQYGSEIWFGVFGYGLVVSAVLFFTGVFLGVMTRDSPGSHT